jgi:hypothetical protein
MKGALIVACDPEFFSHSAALFGSRFSGALLDTELIQVVVDGRSFTMFNYDYEPFENWRDYVSREWNSVFGPECSGYVVECRWQDLFAEVVLWLTKALSTDLWVVDGSGRVWPGSASDLDQIEL